jgi:hypothetical protein
MWDELRQELRSSAVLFVAALLWTLFVLFGPLWALVQVPFGEPVSSFDLALLLVEVIGSGLTLGFLTGGVMASGRR